MKPYYSNKPHHFQKDSCHKNIFHLKLEKKDENKLEDIFKNVSLPENDEDVEALEKATDQEIQQLIQKKAHKQPSQFAQTIHNTSELDSGYVRTALQHKPQNYRNILKSTLAIVGVAAGFGIIWYQKTAQQILQFHEQNFTQKGADAYYSSHIQATCSQQILGDKVEINDKNETLIPPENIELSVTCSQAGHIIILGSSQKIIAEGKLEKQNQQWYFNVRLSGTGLKGNYWLRWILYPEHRQAETAKENTPVLWESYTPVRLLEPEQSP